MGFFWLAGRGGPCFSLFAFSRLGLVAGNLIDLEAYACPLARLLTALRLQASRLPKPIFM